MNDLASDFLSRKACDNSRLSAYFSAECREIDTHHVAFACYGICAVRRTGERLAISGSTAHLIPSLRSGSRYARLAAQAVAARPALQTF